ncbi:MAG: sulfite reductase [Chlamydiia bacterium]|nr:sulfite reductase [Chlamydiia bacterium]
MTEYNKDNPFPAKIVERYILNKEGSTKKTYHLTLDLSGSNISYRPGDAIAIFPENPEEDVNALLSALNLSGHEEVTDPRSGMTLPAAHFFKKKANLIRIPTPLLKLTGDADLINNKDTRTQFVANHDLIDFFEHYPPTIPLQELISYFAPLLPRFYSIASSPMTHPQSVDLLVATFTYCHGNKKRQGLGSHFLCDTAQMHHTPIPLYLHPTPHFVLPEDPKAPLIMVGPGTGVAPYRAFLEHREAEKASGTNWLFFGERNRATDYYYEAFFESLQKKDFLRLDLAFSRDQEEKLYVQHLLLKHGAAVWGMLQQGAYFYICGDARQMAKDVTEALHTIVETHGEQDPKPYIKELRKTKRLLLDVY